MATIIQTDPGLERRRQLAMAMMQQGQSQAPVQHWTQGANRIAQSLLGAYNLRQAEQQQQQQQQMGQEALQQALGQFQRQPEQMTTGGDDGIPLDLGAGVPTQGDPVSRFAQVLAANPYTQEYGTDLLLQQQLQGLQPSNQPANVQEYQYFSRLSPEEQSKYLNLRRSQIQKVGDQLYDVASGAPKELLTEQQQRQQGALEAEIKGQVAEQTAGGKIRGQEYAQKIADLPNIEMQAQQSIDLLDKAISHPGLEYAVGKSSILPIVPGTEAANFESILSQIKGRNFLQAFQSLQGGGQITETEGKKAEQAIARLERAQTEDAFKESLIDLKNIVRTGLDRARAGIKVSEPSAAGEDLQGRRSGRSDLRKPGPPPGWTLMQDAQGNRAYVGPNGEVQEL